MAARRILDPIAIGRCGSVICVDVRAIRSHVSHAAAQAVLREAQMMIVIMMRR